MQKLVAPVGLEPTHLAAMDFESIVSTISPRSHIESLICRYLNGYFEIPASPTFFYSIFQGYKKNHFMQKRVEKENSISHKNTYKFIKNPSKKEGCAMFDY